MENVKRLYPAVAAALLTATLFGAPAGELKVKADHIAADNVTGALTASGHVHAVSAPVILHSDYITRDAEGEIVLSDPTHLTTCTNDWDHLHWQVSGEVKFRDQHYVFLRNAWVRLWDVPVMWLPYWYYPMDTDYGWRVMPGYTSRWGAYLLTKYVYGIYGSTADGQWGLGGNTRFDLRAKNGVAAGQMLKWSLGDFGKGKFKVYYAWDHDADRYDRHWNDTKEWNYSHWGNDVPDERYGLSFEHRADLTERDTFWVKAAYYSDSHFHHDFLRKTMMNEGNVFATHQANELAWEHYESLYSVGASVSGPLNDFYPGVARLPEFYLDFNPMPVLSLPVNYESQTRVGYLDRDYAKYGSRDTPVPYRYTPGPWANYNAFRFDTYHRLTLPMKFADVLSVVPRFGLRGTFWSDSGTSAEPYSRAGSSGDDVWRTVVEGGVTFAARGTAEVSERVSHVVEPYFDVLAQEAHVTGLDRGGRIYEFDGVDASRDWLDQFAGRSRNLPYSWYGVTPGLRNVLRETDERGFSRTVLDLDVYCAVQFNDTSYTAGDKFNRLARDPEDPNYGEDAPMFVPGVRARWMPTRDTVLSGRVEYDTENDELAYASVKWNHRISDGFSYYVSYWGRNHRRWDYAATPFDRETMRRDDFNWANYQFLEVGFEHEVCDAFAWSPYVRWDCREDELDEAGVWVDFRTDCLGFRFKASYENDYTRIDGSRYDHDWDFGFFVYLRALGPSSGNPFGD
jgi:lipopolysaccharide assembly outer membrane protein LptD (OstA)